MGEERMNLEKISDKLAELYAIRIGEYWGHRDFACKFYKKASEDFNVTPELIEDVAQMYCITQPGNIYLRMKKLGYKLK